MAKQTAADKAAEKAAAKAEEADGEKHTYRVDRGEALPPQAPFPTGTDKKK